MKLAYSVQLNLTFRFSGGFPALVVHYLTDHFTTFELENPYKVPEQHKIRQSPDFKAIQF